jgi:uncharacterized protein (TIGR02646 family)
MIVLPAVPLPARVASQLQRWQKAIDDLPDYGTRVTRSSALFTARNRLGNATFDSIKDGLTRMCCGSRRCGYCEDSLADEVEHIEPKNLFPNRTFDWTNYLYACGPCNGPKNNQFSLIERDGSLTIIARKKGDAAVAPPAGVSALIDPRRENPMEFLQLDLVQTFRLVPLDSADVLKKNRADWTIKVLNLNKKMLVNARRNAFGSFKARLVEYRSAKERGASVRGLQELTLGLLQMPHPTVFLEMQRMSPHLDRLRELFEPIPEALRWKFQI